MTSNHAERLDRALVRPGRIDRMILLGNISQRSAELMFLRMYTPDHTHRSTSLDASLELGDGELHKLALEFSSQIPKNTFTPAQLQGYLLNRRNSPAAAAIEASIWVDEEKAMMAEAKVRAKEAKAWRAKRRKGATLKLLAKDIARAGLDIDLAKDVADMGVDIGLDNRVPAAAKGETNGEKSTGIQSKSANEDINSKQGVATTNTEAAEAQNEPIVVDMGKVVTSDELVAVENRGL